MQGQVNGVSTFSVLIADQLVRFTTSVGQDYNVLNAKNVSTNHYGVLNNDLSNFITRYNRVYFSHILSKVL